ncbi:GNAT family N-acetyltransferase [Hydrogenophaga sp.]|uniref:GNAT family N-acetyltransferase n=1 Tax=Hydrogenophaga sp. TaxID=1904254 RepID=UPI002FC67E4B
MRPDPSLKAATQLQRQAADDLHVALLKPSDAPRYRALMLEAYELATDAFTSTPEERVAEPESFWINRIADPSGMGAAFGAFAGGELVGTVAVEFSAKPKTRHKALVIGMYVSPQARGTGAGKALIEACIQYATGKEGILVLNLTVTEGNASAIGLYRSAGFVAFGTEPLAIATPRGFRAKVHMQRVIARGTAA